MSAPHAEARTDEHTLWAALLAGEWPRCAGRRLGMHPKRVLAICEKWTRKGFYNYGVCADLGWPEPQPPGWSALDHDENLREYAAKQDSTEFDRRFAAAVLAIREFERCDPFTGKARP